MGALTLRSIGECVFPSVHVLSRDLVIIYPLLLRSLNFSVSHFQVLGLQTNYFPVNGWAQVC